MNHQDIHEQTVGEQAAAISRTTLFRPMRVGSVPAVDARYWTLMALASTFGCNTGDDCPYYAGWNHWIGLGPLAFIFAALLFGERRSAATSQAWYWAVVIVLRTAATNLADLATHTYGLPYLAVIFGLAILQAIVVRQASRRLGAAGHPVRPATDGWYWLSLLTAGTLGTALGDWVAEELHISTGYATLLLALVYLLVLTLGRRVRWGTKAKYWSAVVAVRAAGTTAGDWIAFRDEPGVHNGLHLGLPLSTAVTGTLFVALLSAWKARTAETLQV